MPGDNGVEAEAASSDWTYPNSVGAEGSIKQANHNLCLQIHGQIGGGMYNVRGTTCVGDSAENWKNTNDSANHRTQFISVWAQQQGLGDLCLAQSGYFGGGYLMIIDCVIADEWGTSP